MAKRKKHQSATPGLILIVAFIFTIGTANPVPFFAALLFVMIYGDKL